MGGPIKGYPPNLIPQKAAKTAWRPPPITIEYVDTESAAVHLRLPKGEGGVELFHRRSRQKIADRIQEQLKEMNIPSLMEKTRERLEEQVSVVKERLKARYGLGEEGTVVEPDGSPEAHGQRMAAFAISMFDHFLEMSKSSEPEQDGESARHAFVGSVRDAVESSLDETRTVLTGLGALSDELAERLQQTFEHFDARLQDFADEE